MRAYIFTALVLPALVLAQMLPFPGGVHTTNIPSATARAATEYALSAGLFGAPEVLPAQPLPVLPEPTQPSTTAKFVIFGDSTSNHSAPAEYLTVDPFPTLTESTQPAATKTVSAEHHGASVVGNPTLAPLPMLSARSPEFPTAPECTTLVTTTVVFEKGQCAPVVPGNWVTEAVDCKGCVLATSTATVDKRPWYETEWHRCEVPDYSDYTGTLWACA